MKIILDDYVISNVPYNIKIEKKKVIKSRKKKEDIETLELVGYYTDRDLDRAIANLLDEKLTESNARSLEDLRKDIKKAKEEIWRGLKDCKYIEEVKQEYIEDREKHYPSITEVKEDKTKLNAPVKKLEKKRKTRKTKAKKTKSQ